MLGFPFLGLANQDSCRHPSRAGSPYSAFTHRDRSGLSRRLPICLIWTVLSRLRWIGSSSSCARRVTPSR